MASAGHRILVTGDNGFVGSALVGHLKATCPDAAIVSLTDPVTQRRADLRDAEAVTAIVATHRPTAVVHLAAIAAQADARQDPRAAWDVNLIGTFNVAQAILAAAPDAHLVWPSSAEAYGASFNDQTAPLTEDAPLRPRSVYGATKAATEVMLGQMGVSGLRHTIFRAFNQTGPGQTASYVVPAFASQIAAMEAGRQPAVVQVGDLTPKRDFLDVRDAVRAYALAALGPPGAGKVYNLSSGVPISIGDVLESLRRLARVKFEVEYDERRMRPSEVPVASGNPGRVQADLGWSPTIPIQKTLTDVLNDWRSRV